jgi:hypothetical protein
VRISYATSLAVVIVGTALGFMTEGLNDLVKWITFALGGGYTAANVLKWHWWRFNSYGYFWGMLSGMVAAGTLPSILPNGSTLWGMPAEVVTFPAIFLISLVGCIAGALLTPSDDPEVLKNFYLKVRPWGWWRPIHRLVELDRPGLEPNRDFPSDMINIVVGIIWQTGLTAIGIYIVLEDWKAVAYCVAVVAATSVFLKFNWYDKLRDYPDRVDAAEMV